MIKELLAVGKAKLASANINEIDGEILMAHQLGITRMELHNPIKLEAALKSVDLEELSDLFINDINRRISSAPVQYITGTAYFRDLELSVGPGVLIPRPETENLVSYVLEEIKDLQQEMSVIDLGAGSGAIALAIAIENPLTRVVAVEKSDAALHWLKVNVANYVPDMRVIQGDINSVLAGVKCDVVITNPPYVPEGTKLPSEVINHEPHDALFGGATGVETPKEFIVAAARLLKPDGLLVIEHAEEHGVAFAQILAPDFEQVELHYDLNQRPRFTSARRKING